MGDYNLFVYGTLQPGHWNFRMLEKDVISIHEGYTIKGGLYFVSRERDGTPVGFPVAKLDEEGTIKGTILVLPSDSRLLARAHEMEVGAGYEVRNVIATHRNYDGNGNDYESKVWAYHYLGDPWGPKIEDGDWATAYRKLDGVR